MQSADEAVQPLAGNASLHASSVVSEASDAVLCEARATTIETSTDASNNIETRAAHPGEAAAAEAGEAAAVAEVPVDSKVDEHELTLSLEPTPATSNAAALPTDVDVAADAHAPHEAAGAKLDAPSSSLPFATSATPAAEPAIEAAAAAASQAEALREKAPSPAQEARGGAGNSEPRRPDDTLFRLKTVSTFGREAVIVLQDANGPCPLIAIGTQPHSFDERTLTRAAAVNILSLRGQLALPSAPCVSLESLVSMLAGALLDAPKPRDADANYAANVQAAVEDLPSLATGLDVNPRFSSPTSFEPTAHTAIFDLLAIPLLHGWIADASTLAVLERSGAASYNTAIEKCCVAGEGDAAATTIRGFLSSSQLTEEGLASLSRLQPQTAVLFRNAHFCVLAVRHGKLFTLVSDAGYADEPAVVWESLSLRGGSFFSGDFVPLQGPGSRRSLAEGLGDLAGEAGALLFGEFGVGGGGGGGGGGGRGGEGGGAMSDAALCAALQEQEDMAAARERSLRDTPRPPAPPPSRPLSPASVALFSASEKGDEDAAAVALACGASVCDTDALGRSPLHVAARCGRLGAAALLLANGAAPAAADCDGATPLHLAAAGGHADAVLLLLRSSAGGGVAARDARGRTPLDVARGEGVRGLLARAAVAGQPQPARAAAAAGPPPPVDPLANPIAWMRSLFTK